MSSTFIMINTCLLNSHIEATFVSVGEDIDNIDSMSSVPTKEGLIYNLSGQRVHQPQNGIYIINGKKLLIR